MSDKRKTEIDRGPDAKKARTGGGDNIRVLPQRVRALKAGAVGAGPVIYWYDMPYKHPSTTALTLRHGHTLLHNTNRMSRDQRVQDNWALLHAVELASKTGSPVAVAFNLVPAFLGAGARHFGFMLRGLRELDAALAALGIPFFLLKGEPEATLPELVQASNAAALVTDYSPLRLGRTWREQVAAKLGVPFFEVDAHNVVPVWVASDKKEVGARTIRPKIHKHLPKFLEEFPTLTAAPAPWTTPAPEVIDWDAVIAQATANKDVPEVKWIVPGEKAAAAALASFLQPSRLKHYDSKRNDPTEVEIISGLSPYLHYGQLAPQRAAIAAAKCKSINKGAVESFLEELVVRRELSDNYCHYEPNYDNLQGAAQWAYDTLMTHKSDKREHLYTREQLEAGKTHDELWNASQLEMVYLGKMHGFMRMYWAKKVLEWMPTPEEALATLIYLNDKYELDGRDPSGYVGCMWSVAGVHDMGWTERPIFGKIRYMNYNGCKRKFKIPVYVARIEAMVRDIKAGRK